MTPGKTTQKQKQEKKQLSWEISNHTLWGRQPPDSDQAVPGQRNKTKNTPSQSLLSEGKNKVHSCYNVLTKSQPSPKNCETFKETRKYNPP